MNKRWRAAIVGSAITVATVVAFIIGSTSGTAQPSRPFVSRYNGALIYSTSPPSQVTPITLVQAWQLSKKVAAGWSPNAELVEVYNDDAGDPTAATPDRGADGRRVMWHAIAVSPADIPHQLAISLVGTAVLKAIEQPRSTALPPIVGIPKFDSPQAAIAAKSVRPGFEPGNAGQLIGLAYVARTDETGRFIVSVTGIFKLNPARVDFDAQTGALVRAQIDLPASGFAVSSDSGTSWKRTNVGGSLAGIVLEPASHHAIALVEDAAGLALWTSIDGSTWTKMIQLPASLGNRGLAIDAGLLASHESIGIGTELGLWISNDQGGTWHQPSGLQTGPVRWLAMGNDPAASLITVSITGGPRTGSYFTSDLTHWIPIGKGSFRFSKASDGSVLAVPTSDSDIPIRVGSTGNATFQAPPGTLRVMGSGATLIAATSTGLFVKRGTDPWRQTLGGPWQFDTVALSPTFAQDGEAIVASIGGPIFRTRDGGSTWSQLTTLSNVFELVYFSPTTVTAAEEGANLWQDF